MLGLTLMCFTGLTSVWVDKIMFSALSTIEECLISYESISDEPFYFCFTFMTDLPPGYPYQSITAPFGSSFPPYHIPKPTAANTEVVPPHRSRSPASAASLPSAHLHSRLLDTDIKPQKLEPSKTGSFLKQEPGVEQHQLDMTPEPLGPLRRSRSPVRANQDREGDRETLKPQPLPLHVSSPPLQQGEREVREEEKEGGQIKMEVSSYSCQAAYPLPPPLTGAKPKAEVIKEPDRTRYPLCIATDSDSQKSAQMCGSLEQTTSVVCEPQQPDTPIKSHTPSQKESVTETPIYPPASNSPLPLLIGPEDPMAGMLALLTASEMAQAGPRTPPAPTLIPQTEDPPVGSDCCSTGPLEMVALEGMALLSQMAQREIESINLEQGERGSEKVRGEKCENK